MPPIVRPDVDWSKLPIEYDGDSFQLIDASAAVPYRTDHHYGKRDAKRIREVIVHQTQGNSSLVGHLGLLHTADFMVADDDPTTDDVEGRGWPSIAYTFFVPFKPELAPKPVIYRCQPDDADSWHTKTQDKVGVGVVFQGLFKSKSSPDGGSPSTWQRALFRPLFAYLAQRYGLQPIDLFTHSDFGKQDCPGFEIETWVGDLRSEYLRGQAIVLDDWRKRQQALADMGLLAPSKVDGTYGPVTRKVIEETEYALNFPVTGLWSRPLDTHVRHNLDGRGSPWLRK